MITLSNNNNVINIYFWKLDLKSSINFDKLLESKYHDTENDNIKIKFKNKKAFGIYCNNPWVFNFAKHDYKSYTFNKLEKKNNNNQNTSNELIESIEKFNLFGMIYENLFLDIDQKLDTPIQHKSKLEFIENISESQNEYRLELKEENGNIVLKAFISEESDSFNSKKIFSYIIKLFFQNLIYDTKLSFKESKHVKDKKDNNIYIIYNNNNKLRELHVYILIFNLKRFNKVNWISWK